MKTPTVRYRLREAWPGAGGRRGQPVHVVDWPLGQSRGATLCGERVEDAKVEVSGTAWTVRVRLCAACARKQAAIRSRT